MRRYKKHIRQVKLAQKEKEFVNRLEALNKKDIIPFDLQVAIPTNGITLNISLMPTFYWRKVDEGYLISFKPKDGFKIHPVDGKNKNVITLKIPRQNTRDGVYFLSNEQIERSIEI